MMGAYVFLGGTVVVLLLYAVSFCLIAKKETPAVQPKQLVPKCGVAQLVVRSAVNREDADANSAPTAKS